ncbi:MAG TPA: OsmC family protein [Casimicrobiaceae bacterium]|nr:OsmC family protein [Casimicrobiaceae bacterium]
MSEYVVTIRWERAGQRFTDNKYTRAHTWTFDGGIEVPGSSSPSVVPLPYSERRAVDPEEAFVASLSSCHMLWFLSIAAQRKFCVDSYVDEALGVMARNAAGKMAMTRVTLRPRVAFVGERQPSADEIAQMHHVAHDECFIANSVTTDVRCEPQRPRG